METCVTWFPWRSPPSLLLFKLSINVPKCHTGCSDILENKMRIQNYLDEVKRRSKESVEYYSLEIFAGLLHQHVTNSLNIVERTLEVIR